MQFFLKTKQKNQNLGFTIIEVLTVLAIIALLIAALLPITSFFRGRNELDITAQQILSSLRLAQNKTLASEGQSSYGVHFDDSASQWIIFKGTTFNPAAGDNLTYPLPTTISLSALSLNGGNDVVFMRLTGETQNYGFITLQMSNDAAQTKTVYIDALGTVSLSANTIDNSNYLSDSRHVHVNYLQNTQGAALLTLSFPDDGITQNINFQDYLNADKTELFWQETVAINGVNQQLKIHTHSLGGLNTEFCFHRDRQYNNKALQIFIDGQNLINYTATGTTTKGTSAWAEDPSLQ